MTVGISRISRFHRGHSFKLFKSAIIVMWHLELEFIGDALVKLSIKEDKNK